MRRLFVIVLSLLALEGAARAADLPPAPELPPLEAQPTWTGFYAGLNVGGGFGSSHNAFNIAGFGLPAFDTSLQASSGAARPATTGRRAHEFSGLKRASTGAGSAAGARRPALRPSAQGWRRATRKGFPGSERCGRGWATRSATGSFTRPAAAPLARSARTPPRRSAPPSPLTIAAIRERAGRSAAASKSRLRAAGARRSNTFISISATARGPISLDPPISDTSHFSANMITAGVNYHF